MKRGRLAGLIKHFWLILLLVLISLTASRITVYLVSQQAKEAAYQLAYRTAVTVRLDLAESLQRKTDAAENIRAFFLTHPTFPTPQEFEQFAQLLLAGPYANISALEYADSDAIIRYVYPLTGNEAALNLDLHTTTSWGYTQRAIQERQTILSDPVMLQQGMAGAVARTPIYQDDQFLGLAQSVFTIDTVVEPLRHNLDERFTLQISDSLGQPFWGEPPRYEPAVTETLPIRGGTWKITVGWATPPPGPPWYLLLALWLGPAMLAAVPLAWALRSFKQAGRLQQLVEQRTAALSASESRYRALVETVPIGVFVHDGERFRYVNPALADILRLPSPQAGIGLPVLNFIQPSHRQLAQANIKTTLAEAQPVEPHRESNLRADGSEFLAEVTTVPTIYEGQNAVLGLVRDVTEAVKAEQQLQKLNRILRAISNINQAIVRIRERDALLQEVCHILVQDRQYYGVWIDEISDQPSMPTPLTYAGRSAAPSQPAVKTGGDSDETMPLGIFSLPILVNGERRFRLTASAEDPHAFDPEEQDLLQELTRDLGFALERMEIEARQARYEEALRASEDRFRRLAEQAPVGVILIQDGLFRYINRTGTNMFGYDDPEELINQLKPEDLVIPQDRPVVAEKIRQRLAGEVRSVHYAVKGLRKDGTTFDVEVYGTRILHSGRPAIISTLIDVTEREQARRHLESLSQAGLVLSRARTAEEVLQQTARLALTIVPGDAINIMLTTENGYVRPAAHEGYAGPGMQASVLQASQFDIQQLPTFQWMLEKREPLLITDTTTSDLWQIIPETEAIRSYLGVPLVVRDEVIGFLSVDATRPDCFSEQDAQRLKLFAGYVAATLENVRLMDSLEQERNRLALLFSISQALSETLALPEVANRALQLLGATLGAARGVLYLWDETTHQLDPVAGLGVSEPALVTLRQQINAAPGGSGLASQVVRTRRSALVPDVSQDPYWTFIPGVDEWVQTALDVPLESHGQLIGVLSLLGEQTGDFDERDLQLVEALSVPIALALQNARFFAQAQQQAEEMAKALAQQRELDIMKDNIVQNVSHDFATPVTIILNHAELLNAGELGPLQPEQARSIAAITGRIRMLNRLVKDMLVLVDPRRQKEAEAPHTPLDLTELVRTTVSDLRPQFTEAGLTLREQLAATVIVLGEPVNLQRVIDNLLANARKFTPAGGQVTVSLDREGETAVLKVCDTGIGIPPDKLDRIFERFYQVDRGTKYYKGLGIGLAMVKIIVEAHGGQVCAISPLTDDPAQPGTCIIVRLPLLKT